MVFKDIEMFEWIKNLPEGLISLTNSGISAVDQLSDLEIDLGNLPLHGDNEYGYKQLKIALSRKYGLETNHIAITPGASLANFAVLNALHGMIDQAIIELPTYQPFVRVSQSVFGKDPVRLLRKAGYNYHISLDDKILSAQRKYLLHISNPHNPSGILDNDETIQTVAEMAASRQGWLLVDEVFRPFVLNGEITTNANLHERIITTGSLTKAYGLGGLRIGWVFAQPEIIHKIELIMDSLHVIQPFLTEYIAEKILSNTGSGGKLLAIARKRAANNWNIVENFLRNQPLLTYTKPVGGISVLIRFGDGRNSEEFCRQLLEHYKTVVVPGKYFEVADGFRLSYSESEEVLKQGLDAISLLLSSKS